MNNYLLYGEKMIVDDSTMEAFAKSIINNIPNDDIKELAEKYIKDFEETEYEDVFMERVENSLKDDISRTDIDYQNLMCKYSKEIGGLLYDIENCGGDLSNFPLHFFGEEAVTCFNSLIIEMVWFVKFH